MTAPGLLELAYKRGLVLGIVIGRGMEGAERDAAWNEIARPISRIDPELLRRRWSVRGELRTREEFGKPHPGDFPGRGVA